MRKVLFMFGDLNDADVDWLAQTGVSRRFAAGENVIRQGRQVNDIYFVLEGELRVLVGDDAATELARLGPGEIVGELSFLDSRPPYAAVVALTDAHTVSLSRRDLSAKLERDTGFAARFYRALGVFLASRMRQTIGSMGFGSVALADADELDIEVLDQTALAAARFEILLNRFRGA